MQQTATVLHISSFLHISPFCQDEMAGLGGDGLDAKVISCRLVLNSIETPVFETVFCVQLCVCVCDREKEREGGSFF